MQRRPEPQYMDLADEADAYAKADFAEVNDAFVTRLLDLLPTGVGAVLDLGTGPADIPIRLLGRRPDLRVVAVDASPAMLGHGLAASRAAGLQRRLELVVSDATGLPWADGHFEAICSNSLLHHVDEPLAMWAEVRRVAAEGATIFFRDLARPADEQAARSIVERYAGSESALLQEEYYRSLLAAYTPEEVRDQLAAVGLAGLDVRMVTDRHLDVVGRVDRRQ